MTRLKRHNPVRTGFTLVEAVMSMLIVAILLVSALRATAASSLMQYKMAERAKGRFLADGLMNEIMQLSYEDPDTTPVFGRETGEYYIYRPAWNDVDDFDGWVTSPPLTR